MKIIHILSGGLDSTVLLYKLIEEGHKIKCLSFDYGQRHKKELQMAIKTCKKLNIEHKIVDITSINELLQGSSLTSLNIEIPEGHYQEEGMRNTVVPNRNMIFASLAIGYAVSLDYDAFSLGVHKGDHHIYPDCRPIFIHRLEEVLRVANYEPIMIITPFLNMNKKEIVKEGIKLNVDFSLTWTCYKGEDNPCGKCGSCIERIEAFRLNGVKE